MVRNDSEHSPAVDARVRRLLDEIEAGAFEGGHELPRALKKCLALGGLGSSAQLRDWASKELNGYEPEDVLPGYRELSAPLAVDAIVGNGWIKGQQISTWDLPGFCRDAFSGPVRVTSSISEVAQVLADCRDGTIKLQHPGMPDAVKIWNAESSQPYQHIERVYWTASKSAYRGIVEAVATKLVQLVAEIRASAPGSVAATPAVIDSAFNVAVHGAKRSNITIQTAAAGGSATIASRQEPDVVAQRLARWQVIVGVIGVLVAIAAIVAATVLA